MLKWYRKNKQINSEVTNCFTFAETYPFHLASEAQDPQKRKKKKKNPYKSVFRYEKLVLSSHIKIKFVAFAVISIFKHEL